MMRRAKLKKNKGGIGHVRPEAAKWRRWHRRRGRRPTKQAGLKGSAIQKRRPYSN